MTSILRVNSIQNRAGTTILNNTGSVIRYADYRVPSVNDNYVTIASSVVYDTPVAITYTPLSASSKLVVKSQCQTRIIAAPGVSSGIKRDGAFLNGSFQRNSLSFWYKGDGVNHHYDVHCQTSVIAGSTNPTTFTMFIQPYEGTGEFNFGWGNMFIQVWEIAQ
jgi:hypothetical protein